MKINEWPIYINDYGHVECYHIGCNDEFQNEVAAIGRRTNFGEFKKVIIRHAREIHQIELTD